MEQPSVGMKGPVFGIVYVLLKQAVLANTIHKTQIANVVYMGGFFSV